MQNVEIAGVLEDVADLLEIQGANPFRIRAYRNAARTIEEHTTQLRTLVAEGADLMELPAIGKDIARHVTELVETGALKLLDDLTENIPRSLIEMTRLPGLGAKRTKKLWEELGIETIDELERAAQAGEVSQLHGFGAKSQQKILDRIVIYRKHTTRVKLADADQLVDALVEYLRSSDAVQEIAVAGSYRRRRETVGDVDLLVIALYPVEVMEWFTSYGEVARVELAGDTKGTVVLRSGLQVDLRILPAKSYGAALQYFTGSKAHNVKLRQRAVARGLRVSEYGVFRVDEQEVEGPEADPHAGEFVAGRKEEEVYAAVSLPWIAPELREDRGEIEAADQGELPELIGLDDIRGDLQMHSTWSDGTQSIEQMLEGCAVRGYEYFAITDHSKALAMTGGLDAAALRQQWKEIAEIASRHDEIRILRGMEIDILGDGTLDLEDEMIEQLDVVLVSIHSRFDLSPAEQTERILKAIQHPAVDILGHPTGRLINRREPMQFDVEEVLHCASEKGVIVELNAHPDRLDLKDTHLIRARELGVKVVISTDAHRAEDLRLMRYGVDQARRAWLTKEHVVNTWRLEELLQVLNKKQRHNGITA